VVQEPLVNQGLLITEASRSLSDTPHSVQVLWTSDRLDAETSNRHHTRITRERHPCARRDSNPQYQQASGCRPTPYSARPLGLGIYFSKSLGGSQIGVELRLLICTQEMNGSKQGHNNTYPKRCFVVILSLPRQLPRYYLELPKIASFQVVP
jgi:hypothetical protein